MYTGQVREKKFNSVIYLNDAIGIFANTHP